MNCHYPGCIKEAFYSCKAGVHTLSMHIASQYSSTSPVVSFGVLQILYICRTHKLSCCYNYVTGTKVEKDKIKNVGTSGAQSSGFYLPFEQVPWSLIESAARRIAKGQEKGYEVFNWKKGLNDPEFLRDRFRHFLNHVNAVVEGIVDHDDLRGNADAMTWFMMLLNEAIKVYPDAVHKAFYHEERGL